MSLVGVRCRRGWLTGGEFGLTELEVGVFVALENTIMKLTSTLAVAAADTFIVVHDVVIIELGDGLMWIGHGECIESGNVRLSESRLSRDVSESQK
jgi:hypothetical protein